MATSIISESKLGDIYCSRKSSNEILISKVALENGKSLTNDCLPGQCKMRGQQQSRNLHWPNKQHFQDKIYSPY